MPEVHSSHIKTLSHSPEGMRVTFHLGDCKAKSGGRCDCNGTKPYRFEGVKAKLYETFLSSPSKGKFFERWIKKYKKGRLEA